MWHISMFTDVLLDKKISNVNKTTAFTQSESDCKFFLFFFINIAV